MTARVAKLAPLAADDRTLDLVQGASLDPSELSEGTNLLQRYSVIDRVGDGGMATIYRAHDERLDRVVCVKLLRLVVEGSGSSSGSNLYQASYDHFLKEALALSKLSHPNTLRIYDFGYLEPDGRPFQISEFLDGGNLEQHARARGALSRDETLAIVERLSGAIAEAHGHAIIHRDIKPSNILFAPVGDALVPKLADFGIARSDLRRRPRPGEPEHPVEVVKSPPLFSPRWAAPEQLAGHDEGPATDVYALSLLTAFMLTGRALFDVPDVRSTFRERVRADDLVTSRMEALDVPREARGVLLDALRSQSARRTASAIAFFEALSRALGGAARASLPPPVPPPRAPFESITLDIPKESAGAPDIAPPERTLDVAGRRVRIVEVHEKLDVSVPRGEGAAVRFRITLLPSREAVFRVNVKGLNCFVTPHGGRASPAIVVGADGVAELVSVRREALGSLLWSFGKVSEAGRAFTIADGEMVLPYPQATCALALDVGDGREIIVICRKP